MIQLERVRRGALECAGKEAKDLVMALNKPCLFMYAMYKAVFQPLNVFSADDVHEILLDIFCVKSRRKAELFSEERNQIGPYKAGVSYNMYKKIGVLVIVGAYSKVLSCCNFLSVMHVIIIMVSDGHV